MNTQGGVRYLDDKVGRSQSGVAWNAPDGLPVHLIFGVLVPRARDALHLQILAAIARLAADREKRLYTEQADDAAELYERLCETFAVMTSSETRSETDDRTPD